MSGSLILDLVQRLPPPGRMVGQAGGLDDEKLAAVLAAARVAPSADNAQTWRFITVQSEEMKARVGQSVGDLAFGKHLAASNTLMVLCGISWTVTRVRREQPFVYMDIPIALTHILLQATELQLACGWTLDLDEPAIRSALSIPQSVRVIAVAGLS